LKRTLTNTQHNHHTVCTFSWSYWHTFRTWYAEEFYTMCCRKAIVSCDL